MVGAGVLALPTVAAPAGFLPSSLALLAVWAYMSVTGLLLSGTFSLFSNLPNSHTTSITTSPDLLTCTTLHAPQR